MTDHKHRNSIEFKVSGRYALFTDPLTKVGGEKCSYHVPTYEALKGIAKSIYWKPTLIWVIDAVRVMKRIRTQTKGAKPMEFSGGNSLAIYTFLADVEYQVSAHFEWNEHRPELSTDRIHGKHLSIARRMVERGGRQDVFLGTRDCQGYVEPCSFGEGSGELDGAGELAFGLMFHGFDYPDESGDGKLHARFWRPTMVDGVIRFQHPQDCTDRKFVRDMRVKPFGLGQSQLDAEAEAIAMGAAE
ncbi:type I-C CRISPR-associated protein Cas5c [Kinneretia asaccharophila]|uniref:pre-crRNA processing endonuclease n=1 Tax=Roseateles asaccharophilus TaxID=582607 RepID=A0A4R6NC61_9BURK|nr:type I-C CRISPR-associated protein Cas5c [Roseateles asaccharophilus]MDN3542924.1 type I-C CRISPR-associated protein Cas5c [Roseateles asaccharophilus]TDP13376.1 CRISPR-associated Cas5d family protein [Roseateles asaccharophilus]